MVKKKHRHKWKWIAGGYARECIKCGKREYEKGESNWKEYQGERNTIIRGR